MELNTASEVISFTKKLEEDGIKLYEDLAQRYVENSETMLSFAQENRKNIVQIERAYFGVISDAIEGCFAFKINPDEYTFGAELGEKTNYSVDLCQAMEMEKQVIKFYTTAAEQSMSLMADVPRVFTIVARKRRDRSSQLKSLIGKGSDS